MQPAGGLPFARYNMGTMCVDFTPLRGVPQLASHGALVVSVPPVRRLSLLRKWNAASARERRPGGFQGSDVPIHLCGAASTDAPYLGRLTGTGFAADAIALAGGRPLEFWRAVRA